MSDLTSRPNVLLIMFDHAGGFVTGPGGVCRTPNLDALAAEGRRFGRCYTTNAICSPARPILEECCRRMWARMRQIGDVSLFNTHYSILRTAPLGPLAA